MEVSEKIPCNISTLEETLEIGVEKRKCRQLYFRKMLSQ